MAEILQYLGRRFFPYTSGHINNPSKCCRTILCGETKLIIFVLVLELGEVEG
jgi:hypothetical protein